RLGRALAVSDLDGGVRVGGDLRAQAERLVAREELVPLFGELRIVREVVLLPMLDRVVIGLRQRADLVVHASSVPILRRGLPLQPLTLFGGPTLARPLGRASSAFCVANGTVGAPG